MGTKEEQIENLFGKLDTQLRNRQTKRALKTADEVLKLSPGDVDALGCKAALLIDLGSVADALQLIDANPALAARMAFERAYCAYRLGHLQDALAALQGVDAGRAAARLQLEAQLHYRLGNYRDAISLYTQLFQQHPMEAREAEANIIAAYVAGGSGAEVPSALSLLRIAPRASFEVAFNVACGLLADGKLPEADQQLQVAHKVGEESLYDEEVEEEEVAAELAPVAAQLAYLAARQGQLEGAIQGLQGVLALSDGATAAVSATNLCAAVLRLHPGDRKAAAEALKKLEPFVERSGGALKVKAALESRLGGAHTEAVMCAFASTAMVANKGDAAKEAVRGMEKQFPASAALPLLWASLLARENRVKEAGAALQAAAAALQSSPAALDAQLMRVQLAAASGDAPLAAELLAELPASQRDRPAVVATRVALLEKQGDVEGAAAAMAGALGAAGGAPAAARWVQRRLAALEVERGNLSGAVDHLWALVQADPSALEDPELVALLPRLVALCDRPVSISVPALLAQLPPPPALRRADLDALEAAGASATASQRRAPDAAGKPPLAARKTEVTEAAGAVAEADGVAAARKAAKKRKRKTRFPKGFDPANPGPPPDPERWLPKWQRSEAKKRKKRRDKAEVIKGSQGAGVVDSSLDKSGAMEAAPAEAARAKAPPGGKKKGKGRR